MPANIDDYFLKPIQNKKDYLCLSKIGFNNLEKLKKILIESFKNNLNQFINHAAVNC
jgi:hypothetical protein